MTRSIILLITLAALSGCGGARLASSDTCKRDGSTVLVEYADAHGSYARADNVPCGERWKKS